MDLSEAKAILKDAIRPKAYEVVSVAEAALAVGLSEETVRRRIRRGQIPAWGMKGTLRVRVADLLPPYVPNDRK